jgi:putative Ca2+/H+ antiporter (TMEM165/GDT1 family)
MSAVALSSFLLGFLLAGRYKVLVLLPAIGMALAVAAAMALIGGASVLSFSMAALLLSGGLQFGYLAGMCQEAPDGGQTRPAYASDRG